MKKQKNKNKIYRKIQSFYSTTTVSAVQELLSTIESSRLNFGEAIRWSKFMSQSTIKTILINKKKKYKEKIVFQWNSKSFETSNLLGCWNRKKKEKLYRISVQQPPPPPSPRMSLFHYLIRNHLQFWIFKTNSRKKKTEIL